MMHIGYIFDPMYIQPTDQFSPKVKEASRYQFFRHNEVFSLLQRNPTLSFEILILTSLNLHYPKMLLHNFKFSGRKGLR